MTLKRFCFALAVASQALAAAVSAESQMPEGAQFSCGRDWMTVRHVGTVPEDFMPGEIVTFRKADVIEARQFGELSLRIYLKPLGRAKKGRPDRLLTALPQIAPLVRKCLVGPHIAGP